MGYIGQKLLDIFGKNCEIYSTTTGYIEKKLWDILGKNYEILSKNYGIHLPNYWI